MDSNRIAELLEIPNRTPEQQIEVFKLMMGHEALRNFFQDIHINDNDLLLEICNLF